MEFSHFLHLFHPGSLIVPRRHAAFFPAYGERELLEFKITGSKNNGLVPSCIAMGLTFVDIGYEMMELFRLVSSHLVWTFMD